MATLTSLILNLTNNATWRMGTNGEVSRIIIIYRGRHSQRSLVQLRIATSNSNEKCQILILLVHAQSLKVNNNLQHIHISTYFILSITTEVHKAPISYSTYCQHHILLQTSRLTFAEEVKTANRARVNQQLTYVVELNKKR